MRRPEPARPPPPHGDLLTRRRVPGPRLRVGLDGRAFDSPAAGVRRYVAGLVAGLASLDDAPEVVLLGGDPAAAATHGLVRVPEVPSPPTNLGWMLAGLPLTARRAQVDVIHAPAYTAPFRAPAPVVLTIHDVSYARHPEWYPYRRDRMRRAFYRRSATAARRIITDSQYSAGEIHAVYGLDPALVTVVPLGVDAAALAGASAAGIRPARVTPPYVLHVGDLHERRNLGVALDAVLAVRLRGGDLARLTFVLAGVDRGAGPALLDRARAAGAGDAVVLLGAVDEGTLARLYRDALALVYPSRYEGFGLPLLEAMAAGTPVVASRAASIPEVVGDAGLLLEPDDVAAWTEAVVQVATDADARARLVSAGRERAGVFTWRRTAEATLRVYRLAAAG